MVRVLDSSSPPLAWGLRFLITVMMCGSPLPCSHPLEGMNKPGSSGRIAVDVIMQPCSLRFSSAPRALQRAVSLPVAGTLQRGMLLQDLGFRGRYMGLDLTPQPAVAELTNSLSLLRLYLITGRIQPSPPSWRKWIFSCCLWPILMDMYTRTLK